MSSVNIIETNTGTVNLRTSSAKCFVFHVPLIGGAGLAETTLNAASQAAATKKVVAKLSSWGNQVPSVDGYTAEIGGSMVRQSFGIKEGEILKVFSARRPAGSLPLTSCLLLRVRESAALQTVNVKMLAHPSVVQPLATIRGRFDVLTFDEAIALGARLKSDFQKFFNPAVVEQAMEIETIQAAKANVKIVTVEPKPSLHGITPAPKAMVVTEEAPRRRKLGGF